MLIARIVSACLVCLLLVGCGRSQVACSAPNTLEAAQHGLIQQYARGLTAAQVAAATALAAISDVREKAASGSIGVHACAGQLTIDLPARPLKAPVRFSVAVHEHDGHRAESVTATSVQRRDRASLEMAIRQAAVYWDADAIYAPQGVLRVVHRGRMKLDPDLYRHTSLTFNGKPVKGSASNDIRTSINGVATSGQIIGFTLEDWNGGNIEGSEYAVAGVITRDGRVSLRSSSVADEGKLALDGGMIRFPPVAKRGYSIGWIFDGDKWSLYRNLIVMPAQEVASDCLATYRNAYEGCEVGKSHGQDSSFAGLCVACSSWPISNVDTHSWSLDKFKTLCSKGNALSLTDFAKQYCHVNYILVDLKSAASKDQYRVGRMYETGTGLDHDPMAAMSWYARAARQGYPKAQVALAVADGELDKNEAAFKWAKAAAEQNSPTGQILLAGMYAIGRIVPQNYVDALTWLLIAKSSPDLTTDESAEINKYLAPLEDQMTRSQVGHAQQAASSWWRIHHGEGSTRNQTS